MVSAAGSDARLDDGSPDEVMASQPSASWTSPEYGFKSWASDPATALLTSASPALSEQTSGHDTALQLPARRGPEPLLWRQALWSPDGTHVLLHRSDHGFDLFSYLPGMAASAVKRAHARVLKRTLHYHTPTPLLSLAWYPFARVDDSASWCIAVGARDVPVKLVDAFSGAVRASYGIMDHVERFVGPHALVFSSDGTRLYAAAPSGIILISVADPGLNTHVLYPLPSQRGQVSSLAVTLTYDADGNPQQELLAVGAYEGSTGVYALPLAAELKDLPRRIKCIAGWKEPGHGVTHLAFHPRNPSLLFSTSRLTGAQSPIIAYDLRYVGLLPEFSQALVASSSDGSPSLSQPSDSRAVCAILVRPTRDGHSASHSSSDNTQQRLYFAAEWSGRWLVAGSAQGGVGAWRLDGPPFTGEPAGDTASVQQDDGNGQRSVELRAAWSAFPHADAVPSATLHPSLPHMLSLSGARHWKDDADSESDSGEDEGLPSCITREARLCIWGVSDAPK